jgi:hypothetical protein
MRAPELARLGGRVYDLRGEDVTDRASSLPPGVYFFRLETDRASTTRKAVVIR